MADSRKVEEKKKAGLIKSIFAQIAFPGSLVDEGEAEIAKRIMRNQPIKDKK